MNQSIQIDFYRDFWDFPRMFIVRHRNLQLLFDCVFDEEVEDYPAHFSVFILPNIESDRLCFPNSWIDISRLATGFLGKVDVGDVEFDVTKRKSIDLAIIESILERKKIED